MPRVTERAFALWRKSAGLSLAEAARRLDCSPRYLRAVERGCYPLSFRLAGRMRDLYGVSLQALTTLTRTDGTGRGDGSERKRGRHPVPTVPTNPDKGCRTSDTGVDS